jgi:hypothetical protein
MGDESTEAGDETGQQPGGHADLLGEMKVLLFRLGWNPAPGDWDLTSLPNVLLPALVLLAAGASAFAVQRRHRTAA